MIIHEERRLIFLQVPQTGGTAVGKELVEMYGARSILRKHDRLRDLPREIRDQLADYTVVSCVRDPLEIELAAWRKAVRLRAAEGSTRSVASGTLRRAEASARGVESTTQLPALQRRPVIDTWVADRVHTDVTLRQSDLNDDFARLLRTIGVTPLRVLPRRNTTDGDDDTVPEFPPDWTAYVYGPERRRIGVRDDGLDRLGALERATTLADHAVGTYLLEFFGRRWIDPVGPMARWILRTARAPFIPLHLLHHQRWQRRR